MIFPENGVFQLKKRRALLPILLICGGLMILWQFFGGYVLGFYYRLAAEQALRSGAVERAAALREKQLLETPLDEELRLSLSALYLEAGNPSRAEYILRKGIDSTGPSAALYTELSRLFVLQDKLQDAVALLAEVRSQPVSQALSAARPAPPLPSYAPGTYNERIYLSFSVPEGCTVYYSLDGEVPSVAKGLYTEPFTLPDGLSELRAVAVNAGGLVSEWTAGFYTLENVVYPVVFEDAAFEALVRAAAGVPEGDVYTRDIWDIETLYSTEAADYKTLNDIRHLPALRVLSLTGGRGSCDISALSEAAGLRELRLEAFGLQSAQLESLSSLVFLETLDLSDNNIALLDALSPMSGLRHLSLARNSLMWLEPLSALTNLSSLNLSQNAVSDILPLSSLSNLSKLLLAQNNLSLLEGIQSLAELRSLDVSGNPALEHLDEIAALANLEWLSASGCDLSVLPDCKLMTSLRYVSVSHNRLSSIGGLNAAHALETLDASRNLIVSLLPLAEKHALVTLDLSDNLAESVEPLSGLAALETLLVSDNRIPTLEPLKSCPSLKSIEAYGNPLTDARSSWDGTGVEVARS